MSPVHVAILIWNHHDDEWFQKWTIEWIPAQDQWQPKLNQREKDMVPHETQVRHAHLKSIG